MKKVSKERVRRSRFQCLILLVVALSLLPLHSRAQTPADETEPNRPDNAKASGAVKLSCFTEIGLEFNDNVFHLDGSQKRDLKRPDADEANSGRFDDMDSASDILISPRIGVKAKLPGFFAGCLGVTAWLQYNAFVENDSAGYPEAKFSLECSIGNKGRLSMDWEYIDGFFKKNYLSGVDDRNQNGNIPKEEQTYSAAVYDAYQGSIAYKYKIWDNKKNDISGFSLKPFGGWYHRSYNALFGNRDKKIAFAGIETGLEIFSKFNLDITYQYDYVSTPGHEELVLIDETASGIDVNDDGDIKHNAALTTPVDGSCHRHSISISPSMKLTPKCSLFAAYTWRESIYTTGNRLDVDHYDQTPARERMKAGVSYDFSKAWASELEIKRTVDDDDDDGYTENKIQMTLKYTGHL